MRIMKSCLLHSTSYNLCIAQELQYSLLCFMLDTQVLAHIFCWRLFAVGRVAQPWLTHPLPQDCIKAATLTCLLTCSITYKFNTDDESFEWYDLRNRNQDECKILKGKVDVLAKVAQHQQPAHPNGLPVNGSKPPRKPGTSAPKTSPQCRNTFYCPQTFFYLDSQCRDDVSESK